MGKRRGGGGAKGEKKEPVTFETVRRLAMRLPGVEEGTSYRTAAFKVKGKLFIRLSDTGEWLVVRMEPDERAMRIKVDPEVYFLMDHYVDYPWVLVRFSLVDEEHLAELVADAWRLVAPKGLLARERDGD